MATELRISFDGATPGLAEHRLSLRAFGAALQLLLAATHRTATSIIVAATDDPDYGDRGGRLARQAKLLDLELAAIEEGSACPLFVCKVNPDPRVHQGQLFVDDLAERTIARLVDDLGREGRGERANASVRKFLHALPEGITKQRYAAVNDGNEIAVAEFGPAVLADAPHALARLVQVTGRVIAVGFDPTFVTLKDTRQVRCDASQALVEKAVSLRSVEVCAAILEAQTSRLLWLRAADAELPEVTDASTIDHIQKYWPLTMRELAK